MRVRLKEPRREHEGKIGNGSPPTGPAAASAPQNLAWYPFIHLGSLCGALAGRSPTSNAQGPYNLEEITVPPLPGVLIVKQRK